MPSPKTGFLWMFVMVTLFGLLVGTLNLLNPKAVHIPFGPDGQSAEGLDGIIAAVVSSGVLGVFFGAVVALFCWLFAAGVRKAAGKKSRSV